MKVYDRIRQLRRSMVTPEPCSACGHNEHRYWDRCRRAGCNCAYRPVPSTPAKSAGGTRIVDHT